MKRKKGHVAAMRHHDELHNKISAAIDAAFAAGCPAHVGIQTWLQGGCPAEQRDAVYEARADLMTFEYECESKGYGYRENGRFSFY